jgi:crotonobetainyl-CoA:carnitine CoA-transferase CaiB-like acyl-CoA transferase
LLLAADVVVEASRPRALEQLGISATEIVAASPTVWISITGYGRAEPERDWVAFGDDAAVAGGLVVWDEEGPRLCADAIADPLTGLVAAAAGGKALRDGRSALVDVAMARVAAVFTGPTLAVPDRLEPCEPRVTAPTRRARRLGEDNEAVRREFAA